MIADIEVIFPDEENRIVIPSLNSLLSMIQLYRIPGVSLAVIQGQAITTFDWGVKNSSLADPVTSSTVFEAASLTKPLVAYLALKLCESGVLELDRPLPPLEENLPPITLRQILSHTAGFPTENRKVGDPLFLISPPGSCFAYSGEGFCYLGRVIEHLIHTPLASLTRELVFKPLHMEDSSLIWEEKYNAQAASPHSRMEQPTEKWKPTQAIASFSLHTTASDFAKFMIEVKTFPEMSVVSHRVNDSIGWGLGWGIETMCDGNHAIWHSGDNGTFQCLAFQNKQIGFVIMTNSANGMKVYKHIFDLLIGGNRPLFDWEQFDSREAEKLDEEFLANWWKIYGV